MKLLHITATHLNLAGGIPVVLRDLVSAQNEIDGFEARVLSIKADISAMNSKFFDFLGDESFENYIDMFKPDVVIFHCHFYFDYLRLYRSLIKRNIPYFIEPHGSFGKIALQKSRIKKQIANYVVLRSYMRHAYGYVFLNETEKNDAQFRTEHDLIVSNGINVKEISEHIHPQEPWMFYYIGRFDINGKGLDCLFDALDILDKQKEIVSVRLYGTGTDKEVEYINGRINGFRSVSVANCGPIYGKEQAEALEQCGIMVFTSKHEGFPMTVLEAWKYGNPCLVTPGTNVLEETVKNKLGWGVSYDSNEIAETMIKASKEYTLNRVAYVDRCKKYVRSIYDWKEIAKRSYVELNRTLSKECNSGTK